MLLAEMRPCDDDFEELDDDKIDSNYDQIAHNNNYTKEDLSRMRHWLDTEKNQTGQVDENEVENDENEFKDLRIKSFPLSRLTKIEEEPISKILDNTLRHYA